MGHWDRRNLLGVATALFGAGLVAPLQRAFAADTGPGFVASHTVLTTDQKALAGAIAERIIPTTDTPGAISAGVPGFIDLMLADWYNAGDASDFLAGLIIVDAFAQTQDGKPFVQLTPVDQTKVLTCAMGGMMPGLAADWFEHCRQLVITGYYTSDIGCRQERIYLPVPGRYDGHYPYPGKVFSS